MRLNAQQNRFLHCEPIFEFFHHVGYLLQKQGPVSQQTIVKMCYLCTQAQSPLSNRHADTQRSLFPTHAHLPSSCQDDSKQTPVYWHETTWMLFLGHWGHLFFPPFFLSVQDILGITLAWMHGALLRGWEKLWVFILMSVQRCRKTEDKEQRECSWSPFGNVKQFTKSGIKSSIVGQNMCLLSSESVSKGHKQPPTHSEGLKYNIFPLYFNIMADEILCGSKFTFWWLVVIWEIQEVIMHNAFIDGDGGLQVPHYQMHTWLQYIKLLLRL